MASRNPELAAGRRRDASAETIAVAAVRYFMLKFSRGKVIAFDIDEALSFEGETGPYLQYAVVRANNIFGEARRARRHRRRGRRRARDLARARRARARAKRATSCGPSCSRRPGSTRSSNRSVRSLEFSVLAKYAFGLAQVFNAFYHRQPILNEEREDVRLWRAAAVSYVRRQLTQALDLMGCGTPARM